MALNSCAFWSVDAALGVAPIIRFCPHDAGYLQGEKKLQL